jgi:hypothetical protein
MERQPPTNGVELVMIDWFISLRIITLHLQPLAKLFPCSSVNLGLALRLVTG